jgi:hypothetical protein
MTSLSLLFLKSGEPVRLGTTFFALNSLAFAGDVVQVFSVSKGWFLGVVQMIGASASESGTFHW